MINCSPELKQAFLSDRSHKNIEIEFDSNDFSRVNFFDDYPINEFRTSLTGTILRFNMINIFDVKDRNYIYDYFDYIREEKNSAFVKAEFDMKITNFSHPSITPSKVIIHFLIDGRNFFYYYNFSDLTSDYIHFSETIAWLNTGQISVKFSFRDSNGNYYTNSETGSYSAHIKNVYLSACKNSPFNYDKTKMVMVQALGYDIKNYAYVTNASGVKIENENINKESFQFTESICSRETIKFGTCESSVCEFDVINSTDDLSNAYFRAYINCDDFESSDRIPLGRFKVNSVEKTGSHNLITKHITAYDGIEPLNIDATNWAASQIGIVNTSDNSLPGAEYAMQTFSTLDSICSYIGFDLGITQGTIGDFLTLNTPSKKYYYNPDYPSDYVEYWYYDINVDSTKLYKVYADYDTLERKGYFYNYTNWQKSIYGLFPDVGGILVDEYDSNNNIINKFCCSTNNYFSLSEDTVKIRIWCVKGLIAHENPGSGSTAMGICNQIKVEEGATFDKFYSKNFPVRLVYYNWKDLSVAIPNVTARDVIRSLIEITGYFMRYGRDGQLEFIQCTKSGLYPSNTLYPSDNLHPRQGANNEALHMGKYRTFKCEDYTTADFGKIQIKLQSTNSSEAITKTYVGNASKTNTYIMDDNVFYCNSGVTYEQYTADGQTWIEPLPEVIEMFENLYEQINNLGYVPHETITPGMPWFECGDRIGILTETGGFETFVFRRTMSGIQFLTDTYEANGEKETESISDYGIYNWRN